MKHTFLTTASAFLFAGVVQAQTVVVTTAADVRDIDWTTATIADLPGPDGLVSFEEALIATNNTPGHQRIEFQMPQSTWQPGLVPGVAVISVANGFFMKADETVTIDGRTQTAFTGDTNPDGWEVMLHGSNLRLNGDDTTLQGFHATQLYVSGSNCTVEGNTGGFHIDLFGGSGNLISGNECGTIKIDRSNDNVVVGNSMSRVRIWGFGSSQLVTGNRVGGPLESDRNVIAGFGSVNSEGVPSGELVELADTVGTVIQNNWIGTLDGLTQGQQFATIGVSFKGRNDGTLIQDNLISGVLGHGQGPHWPGTLWGWSILLAGTGSDVSIIGNRIGVDIHGQPTLGAVWGISMGDAVTHPASFTNVRVGGTAPGEGNVIAGHSLNGITVGRNVPQLRIQGNSIRDNGWLGIDLVPTGYGYGVDPNDALDVDGGGNGLQNHPEILGAVLVPGGLRVVGRVKSSIVDTFTVELFASKECDPSGHGEADHFLGRTTVVSDATGLATFDVVVPHTGLQGGFVTATATLEPLGATSEFSECVSINGFHCQTDLGFGGPGSATLSVCGDVLSAGGSADLAVVGLPPSSTIFLGASTFSNPTPLLGGFVVPYPTQFLFPFTSDASGELHVPLFGGVPVPFSLVVQGAYIDPALAGLTGLTNAVEIEFLP